MKKDARIAIRIPFELKEWLCRLKEAETSSMNYEIVKSIRERKARMDQARNNQNAEESTNVTNN